MIHKKKKELRKMVQELRDNLPIEERDRMSARIADNLWSLPEFISAQNVLFFVSFRSEVNTVPMIQRAIEDGKTVCLPCTEKATRGMVASQVLDMQEDLVMGNYDILEPRAECLRPLPPEDVDLILMPGVAFDPAGGRLGYGGGYYDRFLERCVPRCHLVALAFELQLVDHVPCADHDARIHKIVTERRVMDCSSACPSS